MPFSPVTLLVSPASLSPSGRPLALARNMAASEPWGSSECVGSQGQPHLPRGLSALQESSRVEAAFVSSFFMPSSKLSLPPNP